MEEKRVRINLHEFDNDMESVSKGFREAALEQGWSNERVDEILSVSKNGNMNDLLDELSHHTEPDYTWDDDYEDDFDYEWENDREEDYYNEYY